ncbi:hypothetical protein M9H77_18394 [Catharanthus roseus]|uniref:Uncharacterized protein n=1 Tax=Catharanthus roseus TaxID=4058 RepID=A0ACC0B7C1_CATRO|nr:hypothetical protein M9H77_18394 [Catharanthus roseus]
MRTAFEHLYITQDIHGAQLAEIVESTHRYAGELADQRASIDCQEAMLACLCSRFMPDQDRYGDVLLDHFENHIYQFSYANNGFHALVNVN